MLNRKVIENVFALTGGERFRSVLSMLNQLKEQISYEEITRKGFMDFFHDGDCLSSLTNDDRIEVFMQVLLVDQMLRRNLLDELISDYNAGCIDVVSID